MADEKKRTVMLMLRLSHEERALIDASAAEDSMPAGTWIRSTSVKEARARAERRAAKGKKAGG